MNLMKCAARAALLLCAASGLSSAQADTLTFDDPSLANLYPGYVKIAVGDYRLSFQSDGGLIGTVDDLPSETAPLGNSTQFITALNTGYLTLTRADGGNLDLLSFDMAFVPHPNSPPVPSMAFVLRGPAGMTINTAILVDTSIGSHPFETFNDPSLLSAFTNVKSVSFGFCSYNPADKSACGLSLGAAGQFSMDNIVVQASAVPEPSAFLLMTAGLIGLARSRRNATKD